MRTCKMCSTPLSADNSYPRQARCKDCHKAAVSANRAAKVDYYRRYDATRYQNDPRVKDRHRRYAETDEGIAAFQRARDAWVGRNKEKRAAHVALGNAVRDGIVSKPVTCSRCGCGGRIEGHHHDYSRPLEVEWLCRLCHVAEHREAA